MAVRTTATLVKKIIEVDSVIVETDSDLDPFIDVASGLVDEVCGEAGYTNAWLEKIERWLAAHFYAVRDPRASQETAGPVSATYESRVDLNLNNTRYGQQAMLLDTQGGLARLNKKMSDPPPKNPFSLSWLGKTRNDQ